MNWPSLSDTVRLSRRTISTGSFGCTTLLVPVFTLVSRTERRAYKKTLCLPTSFGWVIDFMQIWRLLITINWIASTKEMNSITRKSVSKLVTQPTHLVTHFVMGLIPLVDEIQFMLISSRHIRHKVYASNIKTAKMQAPQTSNLLQSCPTAHRIASRKTSLMQKFGAGD